MKWEKPVMSSKVMGITQPCPPTTLIDITCLPWQVRSHW